jgi:hypothetical protein
MLTSVTIRKAVKKMATIDEDERDGHSWPFLKKRLQVDRQRAKLEKFRFHFWYVKITSCIICSGYQGWTHLKKLKNIQFLQWLILTLILIE